ncbi:class I SAM-dependent methyltransferase [Sphaerisporangium corydalis]|uniref:Class I SAM-dependent methyltransferase n=1 Tax=Sphaerisporangium corydalis TaxID=1441875 RepID=A0ABV9EDA7_9ACTN|nr:class I SAM-dependent methyltransferase [Sphaerisporangium corydalis]
MPTIVNTEHEKAWNGWEGVHWAENPARYNALVSAFDDALFQAAAIGEHDRVLDVGCGTGIPTLAAARQASEGYVVGVDLSAPMLARARADAAAQGVTNVRFEQGDGQVFPFPGGGFDVAISRGGVMFFGEPVAAFTNIGRALRPGGRLAFMGPGPGRPGGEYARATAALAPLMRGPSPAARGMGSMIDPERIHEVLGAAGFTGIGVSPVEAAMTYGRDARDAADFMLAMGPVRHNLAGVDPAVVEKAREQLRRDLRPFETPRGVLIQGAVWIVSATRP